MLERFAIAKQKNREGNIQTFLIIITAAGDTNIINEKSSDRGFTALHMAVTRDKENKRLISALLKHPKIDINVQDANGWTPLHHACQRGFWMAVSALHCGDFCCVNSDEDSPLHLAVSNQHTRIFEELAESEAFQTRYKNDPTFTEVKVMHNLKYFSFISFCSRIQMETPYCIQQ